MSKYSYKQLEIISLNEKRKIKKLSLFGFILVPDNEEYMIKFTGKFFKIIEIIEIKIKIQITIFGISGNWLERWVFYDIVK
jgi:hypothetical protein